MQHIGTRVSRATRDALAMRAAELGINPCALMRIVINAALALDDDGEIEQAGSGE